MYNYLKIIREVVNLVPYSMKSDEVIREYSSSESKGLNSERCTELLAKYGRNKIKEAKKKSVLTKFFMQFKDVMILILIIAAGISFGIAVYEDHKNSFFEPALILMIVFANAVMGTMQESKAEKALDSLKNMAVPHARVIRDGNESTINAEEIVPGDIIKIEAGDFVPADARLISCFSLKCEESALTGESVASQKNDAKVFPESTPLGDRKNMIYSGCAVTYGTGKAVVTSTGMNTEIGKISTLLSNSSESTTPLQIKLAKMGKYLGFLALAACAIIFAVGLFSNIAPMEIFMISISLAVSAIPEGLPAIVTIVLSIGVQRMAKKRAIIRRLPAVEALGSASVICSDKTGTLTQNRMTLVRAYSDNHKKSEKISEGNSKYILEVLKLAVLCSNGTVEFCNGKEKHIGDPTETAIIASAHKNGIEKHILDASYKRLCELPFDSERKLMTIVAEINKKKIVIVKGAFDALAPKCIKGDIENAKEQNDEMGRSALRVIGVAFKEIENIPDEPSSENLECDLNFVGLLGMIDPPRKEAKKAVETCIKAGIKPVMITGDHIITASAIAKEIGILADGDEVMTGKELAEMSDEELNEKVRNVSVYARVSPEDKIKIVNAWKNQGEVVAMTGDGVNDAPALKAADIGCAMGITGTDVAKNAADMTLTDDNFSTIVHAVKQGRGIYENIKKVVNFLLGTNIGEVIAVFFGMLFWNEPLLLSAQLLWINLVTDGFPAIALGMESIEQGIMNQKPNPKSESIFANGMGIRIICQGIMFALLTIAGFYHARVTIGDIKAGQTMAFFTLALSQCIQSFNMRSNLSLFKTGLFGNRHLNIAVFASIAMICIVAFTPLYSIFGLTVLPWYFYIEGVGLALIPIILMELSKLFRFLKNKSSEKLA